MRSSLLLLLLVAPASAFEEPTQFFATQPHAATLGASSEGVYFTGAPRFSSLNCSSCHTDGPGKVHLKLGADDPDLFTTGYVPGQTYLLEVELLDETRGLEYGGASCTEVPLKGDKYTYQQCNSNSFGLEIDSAGGAPLQGLFCAEPPQNGKCGTSDADEVLVAPDGDAVFGVRQHDQTGKIVLRNDPTSWHLWWTAPPIGTGPLTVYVAAVDGNGGSGSVDNDQDPYDDDTVQAAFTLEESGSAPPPGTSVGCDASAGRHGTSGAALLMFLLLFAGSRLCRRVCN